MTPSAAAPRRLFVAGATGAVGKVVVRLASAAGVEVVAHRRPRPEAPPGPAVFDLADRAALTRALAGCTTIVQLVGTMRKRFAAGDTYETSDIGTTAALVAGAREVPTVDHLILLSSVGAGKPVGAYLQAKARAERLITESGLPWTILRPSSFIGEDRRPPPLFGPITRFLGLHRWQPIRVDVLAAGIVQIARDRDRLGEALEGKTLIDTARRAWESLVP